MSAKQTDLNMLWGGIVPFLTDFDGLQLQQIQSALFTELGKYDISFKEECRGLTEYNEDMRGYQMFFVAKRVEGVSPRTLQAYKNWIDHMLGCIQKPLAAITTDDMRCYLAKRQMIDKISPVSADNERRVFNAFFTWLSNEGYVDKNICYSIKQIKKPKRKKKAFSNTDLTKLRDACVNGTYAAGVGGINAEVVSARAVALVEFLLSTGCRAGEVANLERENVDLDNGTALVFGKGAKERTVYLNEVSKMRLQQYWSLLPCDCTYAFASLKNPKPLGTSAIARLIRELGEAAGVKTCHPHRFRRTAATIALKRGMTILDVQRMLGHEYIETTKIYLDLDDTSLKYQHERFM